MKIKKFKEFIKGNAKEEYTSDLNELVGSSIGINTYSNHGKFFCSKLVPDIWIHTLAAMLLQQSEEDP